VDAPTWYLDVDADGYGSSVDAVTSCSPPSEEWVLNGDDCEPTDPDIHPGAVEVCNGEDDDCDGLADNPPISGDTLWYPDVDRDGFGDASADGLCEPEPGFVSNNLDCGDRDAEVKPGAVEVCNDGLDNDCSGVAEGCEWPAVVDLDSAVKIVPGVPGGFGFGSALEVVDVTGDGRPELLVGEYQGLGPGDGAVGAVHMFSLPLVADVDTSAAHSWRADSASLEWFGSDLGAADFDGDGYLDLSISSMAATSAGRGAGAVFVGFGPLPATGGSIEETFGSQIFHTGVWTELFGRDLWTGDVLGIGAPALVIGASADGAAAARGSVYVVEPVDGRAFTVEGDSSARVQGEPGDEAGWCVTGLDANADGFIDLAVGAPGAMGSGSVSLFFGPVGGDSALGDADVVIQGRRGGAQMGKGCAGASNAAGDGFDELFVGAPGDGYGWAGVFSGGFGEALVPATSATAQLLGSVGGAAGGFGTSVHAAGDLNQDGFGDLLVGEVQADPLAARAWFGPFSGVEDDVDSDVTMALPYSGSTGYLRQLRGGVDLTGDTVPDVLVSDEIRDEGRVWLVPGVGF